MGLGWSGRVLAAGALLALSACSGEKVDTDGAIAAFHHELDQGQYAQIYAATSQEMRATVSEPALLKLLAAIHRKMGAFKSGRATGWNENYTTGGHFSTISYAAQYTVGAATETFVFHVLNGKPLMAGYNINSAALIS